MEQRYEKAGREQEGGTGEQGSGKSKGKEKALEEYQYNFTDPESRIMKAGNGKHFEQSYNAQAAVDTETMLVVGEYVTNRGNDKQELVEVVGSIDTGVYTAETVSADTGFFSEAAVKAVEQRDEAGNVKGPIVYCAVEKQSHHRSVQDLEKQEEPAAAAAGATVREVMIRRLRSAEGKQMYQQRKETVEPVFGIIKQAMGFRQFLLRGLEKVNQEWKLVCLGYNLKRLYRLSQG
jgi:hypothetical protein